MTSRASRIATAALAATAVAVAGCTWSSSGEHPALVICGTTLQAAGGGSGPGLYDAMRGPKSLSYVDDFGPLYFSVAPGCVHGSHVTWLPRSAAHLVTAAYASDGLAAAVVLQPTRSGTFQLVVTRNGRVIGSVTVQHES